MMERFEERLSEYGETIENELALLFHGSELDSVQSVVYEAMRYSMLAGGKRLRPILTLEFCRMLGGDCGAAMPVAVAVEMIHCCSLIHDDLPCMDDDDLRRGKPSCHVAFGEANALLAGDALLTAAFEKIASADRLSWETRTKCVTVLSECVGAAGMIGGQTIDLMIEGKKAPEEVLKKMYLLKTGALIRAACQMGVLAAGGTDEDLDHAARYAESLGLAFQIVDDILDLTGDEAVLGKPVGSDTENDKNTFAVLYGVKKASEYAEEYTEEAIRQLECFPDHGFLLRLTESLLKRNH